MLMKCLTCGSRISTKWLFLALPWSNYRCDQCGSVFAGTISRFILNSVVIGILGYFVIQVIKSKMPPLILLPLTALALVLLICDLPWQIKKV